MIGPFQKVRSLDLLYQEFTVAMSEPAELLDSKPMGQLTLFDVRLKIRGVDVPA